MADKTLTEKDYRALILEEYTFLKRPVVDGRGRDRRVGQGSGPRPGLDFLSVGGRPQFRIPFAVEGAPRPLGGGADLRVQLLRCQRRARKVGPSGSSRCVWPWATPLFWLLYAFRWERRAPTWAGFGCAGWTGVTVNQLLFFNGLAITSPVRLHHHDHQPVLVL